MKLVLATLALAFAIANANVIELGDDDFDSKLKEIKTALVMFYAPWCGHCKKLKPEFDDAAGDLLENDPPVHLVKVDCTEAGQETCGKFEVKGYPTLKIFRSGKLSNDYNGPREAGGIVKYMKSQVGPASKEITNDEDYKKRLETTKEVVVDCVLEDEKEMQVCLDTASKMRETTAFIHSKKSGKVRKAGIYLHRPKHLQSKLEDAAVKYEGKLDETKLEKWIKEKYHGLAGHRTFDNLLDFSNPLVVVYYDVDYKKDPKGTNYWRNRVIKVAKNFPKIKFAVSSKYDFAQELQEFSLVHVPGDKPVVGLKDEDGVKYRMEGGFDVDSLTKFLKQFEAGELEPHLKSEPIPENNDAGVKIAVAKNFDELVTKSDKDVLIKFYAPWCGHCKSMAPAYDELGEKMKDEDVEIVKMDATANDVPKGFDVKGFPTLIWIKKGEKPVSYSGGRTYDDFVKYIAKHATNELKGFNRKGKAKKSEL